MTSAIEEPPRGRAGPPAHVGQACPLCLAASHRLDLALPTRRLHSSTSVARVEENSPARGVNHGKGINTVHARMHNISTEFVASRSTRYIDIASGIGTAKKSLNISTSERVFYNDTAKLEFDLGHYYFFTCSSAFPHFSCGCCSSFPCRTVPSLFVAEAIIGPQYSGLGVRPTGAAKSRKGKNRNEDTDG